MESKQNRGNPDAEEDETLALWLRFVQSIAPVPMNRATACAVEDEIELSERVYEVISGMKNDLGDVGSGADMDDDTLRHLHALVCRGVPASLRGAVWRALNDVPLFAHARSEAYSRLVQMAEDRVCGAHDDVVGTAMQRELRQIDVDVPRCVPSKVDQNKLRSLLRTHCVVYTSLGGYCQGMHFIASTLLHVLGDDEESAFWCFHNIIERVAPSWYSERTSMHDATADVLALERLVQLKLPRVARTLERFEVPLASACLGWFLRFFVSTLPFTTVLRVFDMLLCEMSRAPLFRVALALLEHNAVAITRCTDSAHLMSLLCNLTHAPGEESALLYFATCGYYDVSERWLDALKEEQLLRIQSEPDVEQVNNTPNDSSADPHESTACSSTLPTASSSRTDSDVTASADGSVLHASTARESSATSAFRRASEAVRKASSLSPFKTRKSRQSVHHDDPTIAPSTSSRGTAADATNSEATPQSLTLECGQESIQNSSSSRKSMEKKPFFRLPEMMNSRRGAVEIADEQQTKNQQKKKKKKKKVKMHNTDMSESAETQHQSSKSDEQTYTNRAQDAVQTTSEKPKRRLLPRFRSKPNEKAEEEQNHAMLQMADGDNIVDEGRVGDVAAEENYKVTNDHSASEQSALEAKVNALELALADLRAEIQNERQLRQDAEAKVAQCTCGKAGNNSQHEQLSHWMPRSST